MSLNFHGSFSYKNDLINVIKIRDNVNMRVQRENNQVAVIYFVNDQDNRIRIPQGIIVRDTTDNTNVRPSRFDRQSFPISWVSSYEIYLNGEHIVSLDNQKQQAIKGIDALAYSTTDGEDSGSDGEDGGSDGEDGGRDGEDSGSDGEDSDSDDEDSVVDDESNEGEDWGQLIRNYFNEIHRIITRGHRTLRIPRQGRRDWIIFSSRRNTRGGSTLLHSNHGDFQVTLSGNIYRFDGFFLYYEDEDMYEGDDDN
ncbi:unnamed protein product [Rhizophagus irregularis]|uniref:Uncharacterized protein n=1 Tax=Rhizophagus irregularis TaxID=588596 RepID=A0A2I1F6T5_9GLOM|nr:hypothetical protein RhiirB3_446966 [Rhizophagus irregularis]CAB5374816.1 unnamed protein product [Rhizophagus irregularis]